MLVIKNNIYFKQIIFNFNITNILNLCYCTEVVKISLDNQFQNQNKYKFKYKIKMSVIKI